MAILAADHLDVGYAKKLIIHDLSIRIPKGKITTLIGPNGSGKSTLIRSLARLLKPTTGSIYLDGIDLNLVSTQAVAQKISVLPQTSELASDLSVYDLVAFGRMPYRKAFSVLSTQDKEKINWAIERVGLKDLRQRPLGTLSGGQRQRAWIALTLAQDTEIMILDEPTTYLDLTHQLEIMLLLQELNQTEHRTIVMALHDLNHAARFSDYLIALKSGTIYASGSVQDVMTRTNLREVFAIDATLITHNNRPLILTYDQWQGGNSNAI